MQYTISGKKLSSRKTLRNTRETEPAQTNSFLVIDSQILAMAD